MELRSGYCDTSNLFLVYFSRYLLFPEENQILYVGKKAPVRKILLRRIDTAEEVVPQIETIGLIRGTRLTTQGGTLIRVTMRRRNMNLEGPQTKRMIILLT